MLSSGEKVNKLYPLIDKPSVDVYKRQVLIEHFLEGQGVCSFCNGYYVQLFLGGISYFPTADIPEAVVFEGCLLYTSCVAKYRKKGTSL